MTQRKIATCCYCGTRAMLVLAGTERHELACSGCGAPLHEMKALRPVETRRGERELVRPSAVRGAPPKPARPPKKRKKAKRRKGLMRSFLEEAFDAIEDILD